MQPSNVPKICRRAALAGLGMGGYFLLTCKSQAGEKSATGKCPPLVMATDLFRPHDDPDDHWDLATGYALAFQGWVDLKAVLIDFPRPNSAKDPDVLAVSQLNYITGLKVPVVVGSPHPYAADATLDDDKATLRRFGSLWRVFEESPEPVIISVAGSCRDIATAAKLRPALFANKCAAVYVNAGVSRANTSQNDGLEWNVHLDPAAYQAMFELPCPVYWMPCFEDVRKFQVAEYATYFQFQQGEILGQVSPSIRKFFAYVFEKNRSPVSSADWLQYLSAEENVALLSAMAQQRRNMWCTGGFLHAAGLKVTPEGELVPAGSDKPGVFEFVPVIMSKCEGGVVEWQPGQGERRFIFRVTDRERYASAMTKALLTLLRALP